MASRSSVAKTPARKSKTLTKSRLEDYRVSLEEKRQDFLDLYRHDLKVGQSASDEGTEDLVDVANKAYDRELMLQLSSTERTLIAEVDDALDRLDADVFGICTHCREPIGIPRLDAVPWARYCIRCQERQEHGLLD